MESRPRTSGNEAAAPATPPGRLRRLVGDGLLAAASAWSAAALWFDGPTSRWLATGLVALFFGAVLASRNRGGHAGWALLPCVAVCGWWLSIPPRNDRDWLPDVARTPTVTRDGDVVTVRDVRNFEYRSETDFDPRWETRRYDLDRVTGLDLAISYWGPTLVAHTILSWRFEDAPALAVSIETRKEKGESYSALRGFFRQFELVYVIADERDVLRLRTGFRGERVFLYRLAASPADARALLEQYLAEADALAREPAWYNAFSQNCTTTIWRNVKALAPDNPFDWRLLANGHLDRMLYERGSLATQFPFDELRARSEINTRAEACAHRPDFSACIREGLPRPANAVSS